MRLMLLLATVLPGCGSPSERLTVYCAASMRKPLEQLAASYEAQHGVHVQLQYGGSNTLLTQVELSRSGDLFIAADDYYLQLANDRDLVGDSHAIAQMQAVVVLAKTCNEPISGVADLVDRQLRVSMGEPEMAAIGKVTRQVLEPQSLWVPLRQLVKQHGVFKPTVGDVVVDVHLGTVDAGIVWDAVARQYPDLQIVAAPELADANTTVAVAVLRSSRQRDEASRFADFLANSNTSAEVFTTYGYGVARPQPEASP